MLSTLKEKYWREAAQEYCKRLNGYCDLNLIEIKPAALPDKPSPAQIRTALEREAAVIETKIPRNHHVIALCVEGKPLSSEAFAAEIENCADQGQGITFLIGSSHGLAETIKRQSHLRLSFSSMTFPHQLFRVMLFEQLYRAFQIIHGGEYHK